MQQLGPVFDRAHTSNVLGVARSGDQPQPGLLNKSSFFMLGCLTIFEDMNIILFRVVAVDDRTYFFVEII